jgi:hypothetical protein
MVLPPRSTTTTGGVAIALQASSAPVAMLSAGV